MLPLFDSPPVFLSPSDSPSGCTFWGKKPWSRKKKILWQLGTLIGAPVGITLIAGIAVPAMVIGIPVYVGRKVRKSRRRSRRFNLNLKPLFTPCFCLTWSWVFRFADHRWNYIHFQFSLIFILNPGSLEACKDEHTNRNKTFPFHFSPFAANLDVLYAE